MANPKPKKIVIGKSFRLFDFHVYDSNELSDNASSGTSSDISLSGESSDYDSDSNFVPIRQYKQNQIQKQKSFIIQMFGINEQGETASIIINDYMPFFYIHVGDKWDESIMHGFINELLSRVGMFHKDAIDSFELVEHHKLYGFTAGKLEKFIRIVFKNQATMNRFKNLWYESPNRNQPGSGEHRKLGKICYQYTMTSIYESGIPPLLRYFHIQNISPSGWVFVPTPKVVVPNTKTTTCTYEYICNVSQLKPLPHKETAVPYKICSFDIEASSSHGDFPLPVKSYKRLAMNLVDVVTKQADSKMSQERGSLLIRKIVMSAFGYEKFDDVDLVYPKVKPNKTHIMDRINIMLSTPIEKAKKMVDDKTTKSAILSIVDMFSPIDNNAGESGAVGNDSDDDEPDEERQVWKSKSGNNKKVMFSDKRQNTIVDILLSNDYDRDQKISCTDEIMTYLFPDLKGDEVTFIGSTFLKYGEKEPCLNHCIVVGSCDHVDGAIIESVSSEKELLLRWTEIIQEENPDIIIGYNIFGFDYEFMFRRSIENNCVSEFLQLSRRIEEVCAKQKQKKPEDGNDGEYSAPTYEIEHTIVKLASGDYDLRYPKITGRLQIDMYTYLRRDFNLSSYKLDDVAGSFISDDIVKIEHQISDQQQPITCLYTKNIAGLHEHDYIHIELTNFTSDYYAGGQKFHVLEIRRDVEIVEKEKKNKYHIIVIPGHQNIGESKTIKWGIAKDDVTPQDIFRLSKGSAADRAVVAKYCIQDCNLVHNLMNKIDVITGYSEMARICSVPISFLVFRGQGIKLTSYVAKKCREKNTLMPDLEKSGENDGYEGAIVLPPKCSMYMDNPVACVDYASLYPSSMISQNLSHDSKVWTKEYDLTGKLIRETGEQDNTGKYIYDNLEGYQYIDLEFDTFKYLKKTPTSRAEKTKCGTMICRWAQFPDGKKGIMPSILEELLKARSDTRKIAKNETDPFMANILDKRQLGYKVTANSLYGQCGAKTSTFYEKDVAASTTATGRMMITYARRIIEEVYGSLVYDTECHGPVKTNAEYVYGDTDSVFFTFNLTDPNTGQKIRGQKALEMTIEIAQDAAQLCTSYLKPPMELSYEKTLMPFILLSKKRYVGMLYETDPNKGKLKYMGLSLKRRDSCDYLKDVYGGILNILMKKNDVQSAIEFLNGSLDNLIEGKVSMDKLIITKALRGYYKNPNQIAHSVLADRIGKRDPGNKPKPGDRMKYVHVVNPNRAALQGEKIETPEYIIANSVPIDYTHYITNQLMKPLQQLFGLALEQIWEHQGKMKKLKEFSKEMDALKREYPDLEVFMKKKEKHCSKEIKVLLFDKYLIQIFNRQNGIRKIDSFFVAKK